MWRCECCELPLDQLLECGLCHAASLVSPPHLCLIRGELIPDEDECEPQLAAIAPDHESGQPPLARP